MPLRARLWMWGQWLTHRGVVDWTKYRFEPEEFKDDLSPEVYEGLLRLRDEERQKVRERRQNMAARFAIFAVYGIVIWGTADESRNLSEWRQWALYAFWTLIFFVLLAFAFNVKDD